MRLIDADALKSKIREQSWKQETKVSLMLDWILMQINEMPEISIEALQQENEQLKDENASLRNWNACEEELHNELLESDKRRWELESELEDANNYREGLEAIIDKLRAQVARMREALTIANNYMPDIGQSDVEALRKAREAIIAWDRVNWCDCDRCKNMRDAIATIDKAIGGKEDDDR